MNCHLICFHLTLLIVVTYVVCKPFGGNDNGNAFDRPSNFLGKQIYQNWRSAFNKRFGMVPSARLGYRPARWLDWSQIYGDQHKRGLGENQNDRLGLGLSYGQNRWSNNEESF